MCVRLLNYKKMWVFPLLVTGLLSLLKHGSLLKYIKSRNFIKNLKTFKKGIFKYSVCPNTSIFSHIEYLTDQIFWYLAKFSRTNNFIFDLGQNYYKNVQTPSLDGIKNILRYWRYFSVIYCVHSNVVR